MLYTRFPLASYQSPDGCLDANEMHIFLIFTGSSAYAYVLVNKNNDKKNFISYDYADKEKPIKNFLISEKEKLLRLKSIFTGKINSSDAEIKTLLLSMPYLYLHFPDYNSLSETLLDKHFLSRVRIEIEYFLKIHLTNENFIN